MSASDDRALLRRYEPVLIFSPDERFFPTPVEDFIRRCRFWRVPLRIGRQPLVRLKWRSFDPEQNLDDAIAQLTNERARKGFVYLEFVDRRSFFPLFKQAWPLISIESGLGLLPPVILFKAILLIAKVISLEGTVAHTPWLAPLGTILLGIALGLLGGGTILAVGRRLLNGPDAFGGLPRARLLSFQTLVTLDLMGSAIVGSIVVGPVDILANGNLLRGVILWAVGWILAITLVIYIPQFFRTGVLKLSSLFALISGLNDGTGDWAAKRSKSARGEMAQRTFPYYGRVWPQDPEARESYQYVALQYWFFYPFNDWRTQYNGIDDHEGDWEQVTVILAREQYGGELTPIYLVYSQHILPGAYLRRAWDDPGIKMVEDRDGNRHPVAYVAAGSHAHYYRQGRHGLEELLRSNKLASGFYAALLRNREKGLSDPTMQREDVNIAMARPISLGILGEYLFVWEKGRLPELERVDVEELIDYAGISPSDPFSMHSGPSIGPGQEAEWDCVVISDESPEWMRYNGNWGKYVSYFGESAPRGPRFASKREDRSEWSDPVNAAGLIPVRLEKPAPPQADPANPGP